MLTHRKTSLHRNGLHLDEKTENRSKMLVTGKNVLLMEAQSRKRSSGNLSLLPWHNSPLSDATWYFHGGLDELSETAIIGSVTDWRDLLAHSPWQVPTAAIFNLPAFWKCTFAYQTPAHQRQTIGLTIDGLQVGQVWLNGYNLGRRPQSVLMYMPDCWLKNGVIDLAVFDLDGARPVQTELARYEEYPVAYSK